MEAAAEILRRMPPRVYHHDFDDNGILNYVATNGGTTAHVNPHTSGKVIVTPSSIHPGHGTVEGFIGRSPPTTAGGYNFTKNAAGSSVAIQLPLPVCVTRYTLRLGRADANYVLRNWNFEGSNDGVEWARLRQHANDQSIALQAHSTASWDVDNGDRAFSRYRILATGPDSNGSNFLAVGGLELYGQVAGVAPGQIPTEGTLQEIADAHNQRVDMALQERERIVAAEDAVVRAAEAEAAAAQARLAAAVAHREQVLAEHDATLATYREEAAAAAEASATFRTRVAANGLEGLDVREVFELLQQLNTPVPFAVLQKQEVSGVVLQEITETEMEEVFNIRTLGERRRLSEAVRRLVGRRGFDAPERLDWDADRVSAWLAEVGLGSLEEGFRKQSVDGEVLLTLTREDLGALGVTTLGGRTTLMGHIEKAKKQHYAGQVVGRPGAAAAAFSDTLSVEHQRLVLEEILQENAALAARMAARAGNVAAGNAAAAAPPDNFLCPITNEVMEDPVVAADGHTYEREAIETWFRRRNTSPMTNQVIAPNLFPNFNLRSQIAAWDQ